MNLAVLFDKFTKLSEQNLPCSVHELSSFEGAQWVLYTLFYLIFCTKWMVLKSKRKWASFHSICIALAIRKLPRKGFCGCNGILPLGIKLA